MKLRPLNDTLIVKLDSDQWKGITPGMIVIPEAYLGAYKKRATSGTVVTWGSRCAYSYSEGERVFFAWADYRPGFKKEDGDYRFVKEYELLAKDENA